MADAVDFAEYMNEIKEYSKRVAEAAQYEKDWPELPIPLNEIVGLSNVTALLKKLGAVSRSTTSKIYSRNYVLVPRNPVWADISTLEAPKRRYPFPKTKKANEIMIYENGLMEASVDEFRDDIRKHDARSEATAQFFTTLDFEPALIDWLANKFYILSGTIQRALKMLISEPPTNLIVQSPQYTGKGSARVIAMLRRVEVTKTYPQVLCLMPTEDLGSMVDIQSVSQYCIDIRFKLTKSEEPPEPDEILTQQILLGTPSDIFMLGIESRSFDLNKISLFIVSRADELISTQESQNETVKICENLNPSCQMAFFSETYEQEYMDFVEHIVEDPVILKKRFD